jgi:hypothetical protein
VATVIFATLIWNEARADNLSGAYLDAGSAAAAPSEPEQATVPVSLQALLTLEFDRDLAGPQFSPASRIEITQTDTFFRIICKDPFGAETWTGQWKMGQGYGTEDGRVHLIFRSKRHEPDDFLFVLNSTGPDKLLVVEVQRITPTSFGPAAKLQGMYVFERAPGKKKGSSK